MSELVNLGFSFNGSSRNIQPEGITIHYAGPSPWGGSADRSSQASFRASTDHARCATIWRGFHNYHLSLGWFGIAYTSGVCPHGVRFEGRGPGYRTGANGNNYGNLVSYAVCYIGGDDDPLTDVAKIAYYDEAARLNVPLRWKHKDWTQTSCAGPSCDPWQLAGFPRPGNDVPTPPKRKGHKMISTVTLKDGRIVEFRAFWGTVIHRWQTKANGNYGEWVNFNIGNPPSLVDSVEASVNADGRIEFRCWDSSQPTPTVYMAVQHFDTSWRNWMTNL